MRIGLGDCGLDLGLRLDLREQLLRFDFELLDAPRLHREFGRLLVVARDRQRALRATVEIGVATPIEIVLGDRVGLQRPRRGARVHEYHFERGRRAVELRQIGRADRYAEQYDGMYQERGGNRILET